MIHSNHVTTNDCEFTILKDPELFELVQQRNLLYLFQLGEIANLCRSEFAL